MAKEKWHQKEIDHLVDEIIKLGSTQEARRLLDRIFTTREINDIARRLSAIELLNQGVSYSEIREKLGLSPVTISKLSNKIGFGFRRTNEPVRKTSEPKATKRKKILKRRYKGAPAF